MNRPLTPAEQSVLSKLSARPTAGFEFEPEERQAVQHLVLEEMVEDHGRAFNFVAPTTKNFWRSIFRLGAKGRALMVNGGTGVFLLLLCSAPSFAQGVQSPASPVQSVPPGQSVPVNPPGDPEKDALIRALHDYQATVDNQNRIIEALQGMIKSDQSVAKALPEKHGPPAPIPPRPPKESITTPPHKTHP